MGMKIDPKILREAQEWTQAQMADYLGCDQSTVSRIEQGGPISGPVERLLQQLADRALPAAPAPAPSHIEAAE